MSLFIPLNCLSSVLRFRNSRSTHAVVVGGSLFELFPLLAPIDLPDESPKDDSEEYTVLRKLPTRMMIKKMIKVMMIREGIGRDLLSEYHLG